MATHSYRHLKKNQGTVIIKVEEVLRPIFVRGLLSKRETQIVFEVIANSWRWQNSQYTQRPVDLARLSEATGIDYADVSRIYKSLRNRGVISADTAGRASFNEHCDQWKLPTTATPRDELSNRQHFTGKSTVKTVK